MISKWDALAGRLPRLDVRHVAGELLREFLRRTLSLAKKDCDWIWYTAESSMDTQTLVNTVFATSADVSDRVFDHVSNHCRKHLHNERDVYIRTELGRLHLPGGMETRHPRVANALRSLCHTTRNATNNIFRVGHQKRVQISDIHEITRRRDVVVAIQNAGRATVGLA